MTTALDAAAWPLSRLSEAVLALAQVARFSIRDVKLPGPPPRSSSSRAIHDWLAGISSWIGVNAEPVECAYADVEGLLRRCSPALLELAGAEPTFLVIIGAGRRLRLLCPDGQVRMLPVAIVRDAVCAVMEEPHRDEVERLLDEVQIPRGKRDQARRALLRERVSAGGRDGEACWLLRPDPGCLSDHTTQERIAPCVIGLFATYLTYYVLWLGSWWLLGRGALSDRFDPGWLSIWVLVLLTTVPFWLLSSYFAGTLAIRVGTLLKSRLLTGALRLEPDEIRHQGIGQLLGRVIESEVVETLGVNGAIQGLLALLELALSVLVMATAPSALLQIAVLFGWLAAAGVAFWRYIKRKRLWTRSRLDLTHGLVENMVGHRTRLAQESPAELHTKEDEALSAYVEQGRRMDRLAAGLVAILPRGYFLVGILALVPAFLSPDSSVTALAVGVGGTLLAYRALHRLAEGMSSLAGAAISFEQVRDLFVAANRRFAPGLPEAPLLSGPAGDRPKVLEGRELVFQHRGRSQPVLRGVSLELRTGDRVLLQGRSGSGKSTLAAILAGLRSPDAGLLLLRSLDRQTLGQELWRHRVVLVPQFHENHILSARLAFNLLMGTEWPPQHVDDYAKADAVCRALDLGPLLDRMPGGILQMVGDTGWQLSHGERSRVYLARALLQGADVVLLDESFGALDPETLERALDYVLEEVPTLIVIAHP